MWDTVTGRRLDSFPDVVSATWWGGIGTPMDQARPSRDRNGWFVVATPELLRVLPALSGSNEQGGGSGADRASGSGAGRVPVAEGFFHLERVDRLVLGTGGTEELTFAVSDGSHVSLYTLELP